MPNSASLVSASEDCTIKVWNLNQLGDLNQSNHLLQDMEPFVSLRGHTGPIMSIGVAQS